VTTFKLTCDFTHPFWQERTVCLLPETSTWWRFRCSCYCLTKVFVIKLISELESSETPAGWNNPDLSWIRRRAIDRFDWRERHATACVELQGYSLACSTFMCALFCVSHLRCIEEWCDPRQVLQRYLEGQSSAIWPFRRQVKHRAACLTQALWFSNRSLMNEGIRDYDP